MEGGEYNTDMFFIDFFSYLFSKEDLSNSSTLPSMPDGL